MTVRGDLKMCHCPRNLHILVPIFLLGLSSIQRQVFYVLCLTNQLGNTTQYFKSKYFKILIFYCLVTAVWAGQQNAMEMCYHQTRSCSTTKVTKWTSTCCQVAPQRAGLNILSRNTSFMTVKCFRLIAAVFNILSSEVLGYDVNVVTKENNLDKDETFDILSSCNSPL